MAQENTVKQPSKVAKFFKDYKSEFKKIVWPTTNDTTRMTIVTIVAIVISGAAIFLLDNGFSYLLDALASLFAKL